MPLFLVKKYFLVETLEIGCYNRECIVKGRKCMLSQGKTKKWKPM